MVSWGGEENRVREARSEGSRADRLALENGPLSPTLTPYRNPRIDHFPSLLSPNSGSSLIHLSGAWRRETEAKPTKTVPESYRLSDRGREAGELQMGRRNPKGRDTGQSRRSWSPSAPTLQSEL